MANTKPLASQVKYGSGNNTVDKTLKKSILSFPTLVDAQSAATTMPDGQEIEAPNADGRISRFEVQSGALVFKDFAPDAIRLQSYTALRAYSGGAVVVDITNAGIAGRFSVVSGDTTSADNGGTLIVDANGRRWQRIYNCPVDPAWFGALDNGSDATATWQAAVNSLGIGEVVDGRGRTYTVASILFKSFTETRNVYFKTLSGSVDFVSPVTINGVSSAKVFLRFENVHVDGNRQNQTSVDSPTEDGGRHGFRILGRVSDLTIRKCSARYCAGDGLELFSANVSSSDNDLAFKNILIDGFVANNNRRHGVSADSLADVRINNAELFGNGLDLNTSSPLNHGNRGSRSAGYLYGNGFDLEGYGARSGIDGLWLTNIKATGNARAGVLFLDTVKVTDTGFVIRKNIFIDNLQTDNGVDSSNNGFGLEFTPVGYASPFSPIYQFVRVSNLQCIGKVSLKAVTDFTVQGWAYAASGGTNVLLDGSTGALDVQGFGSNVGVEAYNSTYKTARMDNAPASPALPTVAYSRGTTGTLANAVVTKFKDYRDGWIEYSCTLDWTPSAATGFFALIVTAPAGYVVKGFTAAGGVDNTTGVSLRSSPQDSTREVLFDSPTTNVQKIKFRIIIALA